MIDPHSPVLDVRCPFCGVGPGKLCVSPRGTPAMNVHSRRLSAYAEPGPDAPSIALAEASPSMVDDLMTMMDEYKPERCDECGLSPSVGHTPGCELNLGPAADQAVRDALADYMEHSSPSGADLMGWIFEAADNSERIAVRDLGVLFGELARQSKQGLNAALRMTETKQ